MTSETSPTVWNFPNQVSAARLVLSVAVFVLIPLQMYIPALVVFLIAAGTDWLDGWYARRYNLVTKLGRILDPFCDKILICGAFILLAVEMRDWPEWYATIAGWMAVVVTGRELLVTVLRSMIEGAGGDFSAKMAGKLKMVFQCAAVIACLIGLNQAGRDGADVTPAIHWAIVGSVWLAVLSTLQSGWVYINAAWGFIVDRPDAGSN